MEHYFNEAPCFYFSSLDDGKLVEINKTACLKLGYTAEEVLGKKIEILFTLATRIFYQTHFFPLVQMQGHAEEIFITLRSKENEDVPVLINAEKKVVDGEARMIYIGILVHNRKKFEDELVAAKKAAEKSLRENTALNEAKEELQTHKEQLDEQLILMGYQNEELKQFNRVVTHDLQEPLRKLSVFAHMLSDNEIKQDQQTIIIKLLQVADRMRAIVSGLQQYIWITETPVILSPVDLSVVLKSVHDKLKKEFSQVQLIINCDDLIPFEANGAQMEILFYHLLANAIRFRKEDNKAYVNISAASIQLNKFQKTTEKYKYTEFIKVIVKDEGTGFPAEYKEQVFELFKRFHPESGIGIGLSLCKKIIDNHQGSISIDSGEGEGATVNILLPAMTNIPV